MSTEGFHPDLPRSHPNVRHICGDDVDGDTAQTSGMQRFEAISNSSVGSEKLWMGQTHVSPSTASGDHHHGEAETAIYVVSGNPEFVFIDENTGQESRIQAAPGDYVFVPPYTPHREENNDPQQEAVVVIARSTQEAIVVNLPSLTGQ
ncbi:cupin domain-containing protein [Mycolicibacterium komossense]|nr:cupin domain-containing protein [Mycolicibacterium komossense]